MIRVSNSFDPHQVRHFVSPSLGPNCLQRLTADDTSRKRVNATVKIAKTENSLQLHVQC